MAAEAEVKVVEGVVVAVASAGAEDGARAAKAEGVGVGVAAMGVCCLSRQQRKQQVLVMRATAMVRSRARVMLQLRTAARTMHGAQCMISVRCRRLPYLNPSHPPLNYISAAEQQLEYRVGDRGWGDSFAPVVVQWLNFLKGRGRGDARGRRRRRRRRC